MSMQPGSIDSDGLARTTDGKLYVTAVGTAAITGGSITGTNVPNAVVRTGIAFIHISSGSIGNNGALTGITALSRIYSEGAYCYYPASAIVSGSTAGWYWTVFSSTTAGTIYNSTYTSGQPVAGTLTAFATTGPGAYTGDTTERVAISVPIAANALGASGGVEVAALYVVNNTAGNKLPNIRLGGISGTVYDAVPNLANNASARTLIEIYNAGATNSQKGGPSLNGVYGVTTSSPIRSTVDTTAATTVDLTVQKATATDHCILEQCRAAIYYAP